MVKKITSHEQLTQLIKILYNSPDTDGKKIPAMCYGKFGIGKCCHPEVMILVEDGNEVKQIPIKDVKSNMKVITLNNNLKVSKNKVNDNLKFYHKGNLINLTTNTGRNIKATPYHSFLVFDDETSELKEKKGSELKIGDLIPQILNELPIKSIKRKIDGYDLNFDMGFILGVYLGDGSMLYNSKEQKSVYGLSISNSDKETQKRLIKALKRFNLSFKLRGYERYKSKTYTTITISDNKFAKFVKENCGSLAKNKFINPNFYNSPKEFKQGLLSGYFSTDGELGMNVCWTSKSKNLRDDIAFVLNSLGIGNCLSNRTLKSGDYTGNKYYRGYIFSKEKFIKDISIHREKIRIEKIMKGQGYSMFDKLPISNKMIKQLVKENPNICKRGSKSRNVISSIRSRTKKHSLTKYVINSLFNTCKKEKFKLKGKTYERICDLINSDIIYDRIKSIRKEHYDGYVYDLSIENNHNFMIANGLFVHNSMGIKTSAKLIAKDRERKYLDWNTTSYEEKRSIVDNGLLKEYFIMFDIRLSEYDPTDLRGLPDFDKLRKWVEWKSPFFVEVLQHPDSDGIVFFDEMNLSTDMTLKSCYKILHDKVINDIKINYNWLIIGAGNTDADHANVSEMPAPLKDRVAEFELMPPSVKDWIKWAMKNGIHPKIIAYLTWKGTNLRKVNYDDEQKYTTERAWERVSCIMNRPFEDIELACGTLIGEGIAVEYVNFLKIQDKVNLDEIVKHPEKVKAVSEMGEKYFVVSGLAEKYANNTMTFEQMFAISQELYQDKSGDFVALMWRLCSRMAKQKFRKDFTSKELKHPLRAIFLKFLTED